MNSVVSCGCGHQPSDSEQIVGGGHQIGVHLHPRAATVASLEQTAHRFHPAERLFDSFAHPLTDRVAGMAHRTSINRRSSAARQVLRYMRSDSERTAGGHELARVVALVTAHGDAPAARQALIGHRHRRAPLGFAVGWFDLKIDEQKVAIFRQPFTE
jgi:hypothetical protein